MEQKMLTKSITKLGTVIAVGAALSGCAALGTAIEHRDLDVQSKMSNSIFLPPTEPKHKTVYVDVHNTSGQPGINLVRPIRTTLEDKGYRISTSPSKAYYVLQVNVLQMGKSSQSAAQSALGGGYGSALSGAALGGGIAAATGGNDDEVIGGAVIGGVGNTVADSLVSDNAYTLITDVLITEKLPKGEQAKTTTTAATQSGSATQTVTQVTGGSNSMQYRTRIVSIADQVNLGMEKAKSALTGELARSIANIF